MLGIEQRGREGCEEEKVACLSDCTAEVDDEFEFVDIAVSKSKTSFVRLTHAMIRKAARRKRRRAEMEREVVSERAAREPKRMG